MIKVILNKTELTLEKTNYKLDNAICILLKEGYESYGTLTVCIEGKNNLLKDNEIIVKTWSENNYVKELLNTKYFKDTKKRIKTGFVEGEIWELQKIFLKRFNSLKKYYML